MTTKIYISFIGIILSLLFIASCEWIDQDLNIDPDSPDDPTMDLLLPASQANMAYVLGGMDITGVSSMWMRHILGTSDQARKLNNFVIVESDVNNAWGNIYGALKDLDLIMEKAQETDKNNLKSPYYEGIAKIITAYIYGTATQLWGDIPFSEALQGDDNLDPQYDSQQDIYTGIQLLLDEAIVLLQEHEDSNAILIEPNIDLIYGKTKFNSELSIADLIEKWTKAAWSLKLRYLVHLSKVDNTVYNEIVTLYEEDSSRFFESFEDDFEFYFGEGENERNPLYQFDEQRGDCDKNPYFDSLQSSKKPSGAGAQAIWNTYLTSGETFAGIYYGEPGSPVTFMTHAELQLIVAEARAAIGEYGKAKYSLTEGVKSFLSKLTDSPSEDYTTQVNNWMNLYDQRVIQFIEDADIHREVIEQKYIVLFLNPEAFMDWRRTGIPDNIETGTRIMPRRFPYSSDERLYNNKIPSITSIYARNWNDPE